MKVISEEQLERAKKFLEYKNDVVKWASECVYVPAAGGDELINLYDPQKRVLKSFYNDHFLVLLKSRQTGFSTMSQIITAHIATFYDNCVMGIISRDGPEASDFNRKVIDLIDKQPAWLHPGYKTVNAQNFITKRGSQLWSSAISPSNPGKVFRGKAIVLLIIDEAAHAERIDEAWTGMAMALSKAQAVAQRRGVPYGTIVLSTPNKTEGIGRWYFERWQQANADPDSLWKPHVIHWKEIPEFANNPNWYKQQCEILGNNPAKIAQELELEFIATEHSVWPENVQKELQKKKEPPIEIIHVTPKAQLWRFEEIDRKKFHIIGIDTASDFGSDFSAVQVVDYETMSQVMEFKGKLTVKDFVRIIKFIVRLVPNNLIMVENNSYGNQVCEELFYDSDVSYNVYGTWKEIKTTGGGQTKKFQPGLSNNIKTRPLIFDALFAYIIENPNMIQSKRLALELIGLSDKGNKIQADSGCNDDLAISFAFCCYARQYLRKSLNLDSHLDQVSDEEFDDSIDWLAGLNTSPLKVAARNNNLNKFNNIADKYVNDNFHKLGGTVNMMDLIFGDHDRE
jgi:hypothetical protein